MRGDESDWIVNKRNGLQCFNMIWDGTETGSPSSTRIIKDVDQALEVLGIIYFAHAAAVEGLADLLEDVLVQCYVEAVSLVFPWIQSCF